MPFTWDIKQDFVLIIIDQVWEAKRLELGLLSVQQLIQEMIWHEDMTLLM